MSLPIFEHPHRPGFWRAARERMLAHHGLPTAASAAHHLGEGGDGEEESEGKRISRRRRKIVYVDRQSTDRRLADADHEGLVRVLKGLDGGGKGRVEFVWAKWEEMGAVEQVGVVADAWVSADLSFPLGGGVGLRLRISARKWIHKLERRGEAGNRSGDCSSSAPSGAAEGQDGSAGREGKGGARGGRSRCG